MALSVDINANTRQAQSQVKDLSRELDKYSDALDDMAKDADRSADKVERSFRDMVKGADKLGDSGRKAGDDFKDGMKRAEEGVEELGDEAKQTAKETAASFDGSFESIVDMAQEVAANAFGGFGPAGLAAGLVAAGGIGLAFSGMEAMNEETQRAAERASEWASRFVEAGSDVVTAAMSAAEVVAIATDSERYKEAGDSAKLWGVDIETATLALSGNKAAMELVEQALDRKRKATEEDARAAQEAAEANGSMLASVTPQEVELGKAEAAWKRHTDAMSLGSEQAAVASTALLELVEQADTAAVEVDELGNKLLTLPDGTQVYIDAQTGAASLAVGQFKTDADGVIDHINGREVAISARASVSQAQTDFDNFVHRNNGREIRVRGRMTVDNGGWD